MQDRDEPDGSASDPASGPHVGIFWGVLSRHGMTDLMAASVPLAEAEAYGDCLGFPLGHVEVWTAWQRLGASALRRRGLPAAVTSHEYEHFPRGRIVYMVDQDVFTIYADRKLQTPAILGAIARRFGFAHHSFVVRSDAHYRTTGR